MPFHRVELVELDRFILFGADVFAHQIQLGHRNKQRVGTRIADLDVILGHAVNFPLDHSFKHADAVSGMNHIVAKGQIGQRANLFTRFFGLFPFDRFSSGLAVGNEGKF